MANLFSLAFLLCGTAAPMLGMEAAPRREFVGWPVYLGMLGLATVLSVFATRKSRLVLLLLVALLNFLIVAFALFAGNDPVGAATGAATSAGVMFVYVLFTATVWSFADSLRSFVLRS